MSSPTRPRRNPSKIKIGFISTAPVCKLSKPGVRWFCETKQIINLTLRRHLNECLVLGDSTCALSTFVLQQHDDLIDYHCFVICRNQYILVMDALKQ